MADLSDDNLLPRVAAIWAEALELDHVDADADFLALGGHSLAAIKVTAQVREIVSAEVPLDLVFHHLVLSDYIAALAQFST